MAHPLISVILCSTLHPQRRGSLCHAIASIMAQTYPHIELLLIHNGSPPEQKELIPPFPLRYYYLDIKNHGYARAFGASMAQGEFLAYIDDDDFWDPHKLERQLAFLQQYALDFVACNGRLEHPRYTLLVDNRYGKLSYKKTFLTQWTSTSEGFYLPRSASLMDVITFPCQPSGWLMKTGLAQKYPCRTLFFGEDWDQLMAFGEAGARLGFLKEPLMTITFDGLNMSLTQLEKKFDSIKELRLEWISRSPSPSVSKRLHKELAHSLRAHGLAQESLLHYAKAKALYQESLRYHWSLVSLKKWFLCWLRSATFSLL